MTVSVLVPWRGGCPHREAAWAWVRARHTAQHGDWELVVGTAPPGPWSKARAVTDALRRSCGEILVVTDADVWTDGLVCALDAVAAGAPWAIPHRLVHRLSPEATATVLAGDVASTVLQPPYQGIAGGGVTVLARATLEQVPLDPRFLGWGQEDEAWGLALRTLAGPPVRCGHALLHLWHPEPERESRGLGSEAGRQLRHRYRLAYTKPARMAAIINEARAAR